MMKMILIDDDDDMMTRWFTYIMRTILGRRAAGTSRCNVGVFWSPSRGTDYIFMSATDSIV